MNEETTLSKILNSVNYGLNVANRALPIYNQAKPLVKKGIDTYNNLKNTKPNIEKYFKLLKLKNNIKKDFSNSTQNNSKLNKNTYNNANNPTFFI